MPGRNLKIVSLFLFFSFLFFGCSATSSVERYSKKKEVAENSTNKHLRFSSEPESPAEEKSNRDEVIKRYGDIEKKKGDLTPREKVLLEIIEFLNSPYAYGGESKQGIDCSAFTQKVFEKSLNLKLPRTASQQYRLGEKIERARDLKFGDLVFFNTDRFRFPGHVGIYLGGNLFAHSSVHSGVTVSSLNSNYYKKLFVGGKRIFHFQE